MHKMRFVFSNTHGPVIIILAFRVVRMYVQHKYSYFRTSDPHAVIQKISRNWSFFFFLISIETI